MNRPVALHHPLPKFEDNLGSITGLSKSLSFIRTEEKLMRPLICSFSGHWRQLNYISVYGRLMPANKTCSEGLDECAFSSCIPLPKRFAAFIARATTCLVISLDGSSFLTTSSFSIMFHNATLVHCFERTTTPQTGMSISSFRGLRSDSLLRSSSTSSGLLKVSS